MKWRVLFRADASKNTGYGHFIRSLALAGYLKEDFRCEFVSFNADQDSGMMSDYQLAETRKICKPFLVEGNSLQEFNENFLKEILPDDIVVLDNYYYNTAYQQAVKEKGCKLVCIDDMHKYQMVCDLLFTVCPLKREDFSLEDHTKFAGGMEWTFLREPFLSPGVERTLSPRIRRIVMAMGGADAFGLTDKMIEVVTRVIPEAELDVICGESVRLTKQNNPKVKIYRRLSAEDIVDLFDNSDVGILSASTICIEAISRKLPVIAGYYVDNQEEFYNHGASHNYFSGLGSLLDDASEIESRLKKIIESNWRKTVEIDFPAQKKKTIELFKSL